MLSSRLYILVYYGTFHWGDVGIMEKKMETTISYWDYIEYSNKQLRNSNLLDMSSRKLYMPNCCLFFGLWKRVFFAGGCRRGSENFRIKLAHQTLEVPKLWAVDQALLARAGGHRGFHDMCACFFSNQAFMFGELYGLSFYGHGVGGLGVDGLLFMACIRVKIRGSIYRILGQDSLLAPPL